VTEWTFMAAAGFKNNVKGNAEIENKQSQRPLERIEKPKCGRKYFTVLWIRPHETRRNGQYERHENGMPTECSDTGPSEDDQGRRINEGEHELNVDCC